MVGTITFTMAVETKDTMTIEILITIMETTVKQQQLQQK